jgi:hypothetical protein
VIRGDITGGVSRSLKVANPSGAEKKCPTGHPTGTSALTRPPPVATSPNTRRGGEKDVTKTAGRTTGNVERKSAKDHRAKKRTRDTGSQPNRVGSIGPGGRSDRLLGGRNENAGMAGAQRLRPSIGLGSERGLQRSEGRGTPGNGLESRAQMAAERASERMKEHRTAKRRRTTFTKSSRRWRSREPQYDQPEVAMEKSSRTLRSRPARLFREVLSPLPKDKTDVVDAGNEREVVAFEIGRGAVA